MSEQRLEPDEWQLKALIDLNAECDARGATVLQRAVAHAEFWKEWALLIDDELEAWKEANLKPIEARARLQALDEAAKVARGKLCEEHGDRCPSHVNEVRRSIAAAILTLKES